MAEHATELAPWASPPELLLATVLAAPFPCSCPAPAPVYLVTCLYPCAQRSPAPVRPMPALPLPAVLPKPDFYEQIQSLCHDSGRNQSQSDLLKMYTTARDLEAQHRDNYCVLAGVCHSNC